MGAAAFSQENYKVRNDDYGLNVDNGWFAAENTPAGDVDIGTKFRIRFTIDEYVDKVTTLSGAQLYYNYDGGGWTIVPTTVTGPVRLVASDQSITDGTDKCSTQLLGTETQAFGNYGEFDDNNSIADILLATKGDFLEFEFCLEWNTDNVTDAKVCLFQIQGGAIDTWTFNASATVNVTAQTHSRDLSDSLTLSDTLKRDARNVRGLAESLTLTENFVRSKRTDRVLSDSLTLTESLERAGRHTRELSDSQSLTDTLERAVDLNRVLAESLTLTDNIDSVVTSPVGSVVWREEFEASPYDNTWSDGETVAGSAVLDSDYATSSVAGAPSDWDTKCLQLQASAGDDSYVLHYGWGGGSDGLPISYTRLDVILESEALANSDITHFLSARDSETEKVFQFMIYQTSGGELRIEAQIWYDGTSGNFESCVVTPSMDTRYVLEMKWDITNEEWELRTDTATIASGAITGEGLNRPVDGCFLGDIGSQMDANAVMYMDNFVVRTDTWDYVLGGLPTYGLWRRAGRM